MAKDILEKFFEELLSGSGAANSAAGERVRDAILAAPQTGDDATLAEIAAHLDEAPDSGGDLAFIAKLASDPDVLHEVESAQDFVERIAREEEPVPATLLRLVGAAPAAHRVAVPLRELPARQVSFRRKPVLLWGGAIAAMVVAGLTGYAIRDVVDRGNLPLASVPTGTQEQNAVARLPPPPGDAANNSASPQAYAVVNPPIPISSHAVGPGDYPPESVQFQEQGAVKVKYLVLKNGAVGNCQIEISSGFARLDDAACILVKQWLFKPATVKDGSAVDWWLDASVVYQLRNPGLAPPPQPPATAFAAPPKSQGSVTATKNEALVKAIKDAQAAAKAQNWTVALEKAKEADAIKDDKPAALNPIIHEMIVSYAINARDFATAMAQLDKNIAAGEGNRLQNLKQALGIAITAKNKEKTDQYAMELGNNLDDQTRLFIATQVAQSGQVKEALSYAMPALRSLSPDQSLEIYRLRRILGDLKSEEDYQTMAQGALIAGYSTEAKSVLDEAAAAKLLNGDRAARLMKMVNDRAALERASITDLQIKSATDPNAGIALGMHLWSTGNYSDAEAAIQSAISRGNLAGLDRTKMALGHVLLSEGKIQEAITTFRSVKNLPTGDMIASLWAGYSATVSNSSGVRTVTGPFAPQTSVASASPPNRAVPTVRAALGKSLNDAMKAIDAKDFATAFAKLREADSVAGKTPFEEYQVAKYFGFIAINQPMPDYPAAAKAYNREVASGGVPQSEKANMYNVAMRLNYQMRNFPEVIRDATELQKFQTLDDTGTFVLIQSYYNLNNFANAWATANAFIAAKRAAGKEPPQDILALLHKSEAALKSSPSSPPIATTSHAVTADDYPPVSIRLEEQGFIGVEYLVKEDGSVGECRVTQSSGKTRLDDAACTMVMRRWKFKPATRNGQPVAEYLTAEIIFQLK